MLVLFGDAGVALLLVASEPVSIEARRLPGRAVLRSYRQEVVVLDVGNKALLTEF